MLISSTIQEKSDEESGLAFIKNLRTSDEMHNKSHTFCSTNKVRLSFFPSLWCYLLDKIRDKMLVCALFHFQVQHNPAIFFQLEFTYELKNNNFVWHV